jgi:hypothetical protein
MGVNAALTETVEASTATGKVVEVAVGDRMTKDREVELAGSEELTAEDASAAIVLASGNLGLVYLTQSRERLTLEELDARHPGLVEGLAGHEGIGFVLVRSGEHGALAIGPRGRRHLSDDHVVGDDPLSGFGPNAAAHLLRTDSFPHVADLMVVSAYDPASGEAHAFEELVGFHGGLGGLQTQPFILFPAELDFPQEPVVGAGALHTAIKPWAVAAGNGAAAPAGEPADNRPPGA